MAKHDEQVQSSSTPTTEAAQASVAPAPAPMMLGAANASFGSAAIARKVALRLARRMESAQGAAGDSLAAGGSSVASAVGAGGGGGAGASRSATDVASAGFSGAGHEVPYRKEMESSFGADFSGVKAHTGSQASAANAQLGSHAYAMGNQVAFKGSNPDKATVAHELTHVVQQTQSPHYKSDGADIDTAGEAEADRVESAVAAGRPASSVMTSLPAAGGASASSAGPARKRVARKEEGGGTNFGMGMTFSLEGFEKSYDYTIWKGHYAWPIGIPGVNFVIDPNVKVSGKGAAKYGGKESGNLSAQLGVFGEVGIGLSGGIPDVAEIYGTFNPGIEGSFTLTKEGQHHGGEHGAEAHGGEAHGGHAPAEAHGAEGHATPGHAAAAPKESGWNLQGAITVKGAAKVGVALGGGIVDQAFELGSVDICKLTGVYFDANGFRKDKLGFEWGEKIKTAFEWVKKAIEKAKHLGKAAIQGMKDAGHAIAKKSNDIAHWVSSWF